MSEDHIGEEPQKQLFRKNNSLGEALDIFLLAITIRLKIKESLIMSWIMN